MSESKISPGERERLEGEFSDFGKPENETFDFFEFFGAKEATEETLMAEAVERMRAGLSAGFEVRVRLPDVTGGSALVTVFAGDRHVLTTTLAEEFQNKAIEDFSGHDCLLAGARQLEKAWRLIREPMSEDLEG